MSWAAALLAAALLIGATPVGATRLSRGSTAASVPSPSAGPSAGLLAVASSLDVLAACLSSGMAVASAAAATGESAPRPMAEVLNRAAGLLALGADPTTAWSAAQQSRDQRMVTLQRLAVRSASSGAALAKGVADLADEARLDAADEARAAAERASVLIAGPLGLCYLPAFVCLGIVPVIAGLAGDVLRTGVL
jgi:pilus assembly protein TadC